MIEVNPEQYTPALRNFLAGLGDGGIEDEADIWGAPLVSRELSQIVRGRHGDLVKLVGEGDYRNDFTYIIDGERVIPLPCDEEVDECGYLPSSFRVLEAPHDFTPKYWSQVVEHNRIIWFDARPHLEQIRANLRLNDPEAASRHLPVEAREAVDAKNFLPFSSFDYCGQRYTLALDGDIMSERTKKNKQLVRRVMASLDRGALPWNYYDDGEEKEWEERLLIVNVELKQLLKMGQN